MSKHFIIVLDGMSGVVLDSGLPLSDYHRTEPCHFENGKDNLDKVLIGGDLPMVCEILRTIAQKREASANIDFDGYILEVETSSSWTCDDLRALIEENIRSKYPDADIDVVAT